MGLSTVFLLTHGGQRWDFVVFLVENGIKPTAKQPRPATASLGGQEITTDPPFSDLHLSASERHEG